MNKYIVRYVANEYLNIQIFIAALEYSVVLVTTLFYCSITIDDVVYVVDTGKTKEGTFDVSRNIACLDPVWVSQASAKQRQGRAGR